MILEINTDNWNDFLGVIWPLTAAYAFNIGLFIGFLLT